MESSLKSFLEISIGSFTLVNIIFAILIFVVGSLLIKLLLKIMKKGMGKSTLGEKSEIFILKAIKITLYVVLAVISLNELGVDTTSVVALTSVISLGVTLALEDILSNIVGGAILISAHAFSIGDYISTTSLEGVVKDIKLTHILLEDMNGVLITVPNRDLSQTNISNYTLNETRRIVIAITASYDAKSGDVFDALYRAMDKEGVLKDPKPEVHLTNYGESSIEYTLYAWVKNGDYRRLKYLINESIRDEFDKSGIEMTYNHLNVHMIK